MLQKAMAQGRTTANAAEGLAIVRDSGREFDVLTKPAPVVPGATPLQNAL